MNGNGRNDARLLNGSNGDETMIELGEYPNNGRQNGQNFEAYIDGPYGEASSQIEQAEHAVLICAGVGVTPFASILQSIWHQHKEARLEPTTTMKDNAKQRLKKVFLRYRSLYNLV